MVVLTNSRGDSIGTEDVEAVHRGRAQLHRAFSIFVFDSSGRLLLQRRNEEKGYGGLWSNTCCSHPPPDEELLEASKRRLQEEMGFSTALVEVDSFIYRATDARSRKTEFEYDHLLVGFFDGNPTVDAQEVAAWRWIELTTLLEDLHGHPQMFTPWFKLAVERLSHLGVRSTSVSR
jgi:isopentenyl-diphosphate delta-isomerase